MSGIKHIFIKRAVLPGLSETDYLKLCNPPDFVKPGYGWVAQAILGEGGIYGDGRPIAYGVAPIAFQKDMDIHPSPTALGEAPVPLVGAIRQGLRISDRQ